ncbi:FecR family protein [Chitinophaga sp.]|uniref:FecR family protein n=1 Tax=Chitinophaga sp. TaxID=1869181 RepID=UPI002C5CF862|nr:FecR domain-containing protein [Chitinophaga sp.]HWV65425.1 FecR domain-containing protein [Chitinophaga sp.]
MEQFDTYLYELIAKNLSGQCTEAESAALQQWLEASPGNRAEYETLAKLWRDSNAAAVPQRQYNTAAAWDKASQAIQPPASRVKTLYTKYAAAAAILVLLTAGAWWLETRSSLKKHELAANDGKIKSLELPDKSMVTLRQGATIRYINGYRHNQRIVELEGEAFFEVASDPGHPFLVKTPNQSVIEVLGTSFTVQTGKDSTAVTVASGSVKLGIEGDTATVILHSGQRGIWGNGLLLANNNHNLNFIAWKTGILQFNDQTLLEILPQLADFYAKDIRVDEKYRETASQQKATITFRNQSCDDVLHELQLLLGFHYQQEGDSIVISQ